MTTTNTSHAGRSPLAAGRAPAAASDLRISIWPAGMYASSGVRSWSGTHYEGTRTQLAAEGLIPGGTAWPLPGISIEWAAGPLLFVLRGLADGDYGLTCRKPSDAVTACEGSQWMRNATRRARADKSFQAIKTAVLQQSKSD
jgi:hypothetical protein